MPMPAGGSIMSRSFSKAIASSRGPPWRANRTLSCLRCPAVGKGETGQATGENGQNVGPLK